MVFDGAQHGIELRAGLAAGGGGVVVYVLAMQRPSPVADQFLSVFALAVDGEAFSGSVQRDAQVKGGLAAHARKTTLC
jgi:hypothetical protein